MQAIVIGMGSRKLEELDIRYDLSDRIETWSGDAMKDSGYDCTDEQSFRLAACSTP